MATRESILREKTFKEEGMEIDRRVFYTLSDNKDTQINRNSKIIASIIKSLCDKKILTTEELDDILLECI